MLIAVAEVEVSEGARLEEMTAPDSAALGRHASQALEKRLLGSISRSAALARPSRSRSLPSHSWKASRYFRKMMI